MNVNVSIPAGDAMSARTLKLKATIHSTLGKVLPKFEKFALLDFPDHSNVGDSAIWLGEIRYFEEVHGRRPSLVSTFRHPMQDILDNLPDGPIFLHGGGNFGDIYPEIHAWRQNLLAATKGRPVVQMPQSIHFSNAESVAETARAIATHGNYSLLVRDAKSFELASRNFDCPVTLCPDMAICLGPLQPTRTAEVDVMCLMRTDEERVSAEETAAPAVPGLSIDLKDWLEEDKGSLRGVRHPNLLARLAAAKEGGLKRSNYRNLSFRRLAGARLERGLDILSSGRWVATDRLHAHILSLLIGRPHVALDNNYGKISSFIAEWTAGTKGVNAATSLAEALGLITDELQAVAPR